MIYGVKELRRYVYKDPQGCPHLLPSIESEGPTCNPLLEAISVDRVINPAPPSMLHRYFVVAVDETMEESVEGKRGDREAAFFGEMGEEGQDAVRVQHDTLQGGAGGPPPLPFPLLFLFLCVFLCVLAFAVFIV